jgi:hypothetical protein
MCRRSAFLRLWSVEIGARQYHEFRDFARKRGRSGVSHRQTDLALATWLGQCQLRRIAYRWLLPNKWCAERWRSRWPVGEQRGRAHDRLLSSTPMPLNNCVAAGILCAD